jgi:hypothetical protein
MDVLSEPGIGQQHRYLQGHRGLTVVPPENLILLD